MKEHRPIGRFFIYIHLMNNILFYFGFFVVIVGMNIINKQKIKEGYYGKKQYKYHC